MKNILTENTSISDFLFESDSKNSFKIRTLINSKDNSIWFVAVDIADILGFASKSGMSNALKELEADERDSFKMNSFGGMKNFVIISESGLYALIMRSRKPITKRVQLIHHSKELYNDFEHVFQKIGIELAITTNRAVKNETTIDFIALSGKNGLEVSEKFYTVTELCNLIRNSNEFSDEIKKLVSTKNNQKARPQNLNLILEQNGFQIKELSEWKATKKGEKFSKFVQNKSLSSTKNIFHLNWSFDVLSEVF